MYQLELDIKPHLNLDPCCGSLCTFLKPNSDTSRNCGAFGVMGLIVRYEIKTDCCSFTEIEAICTRVLLYLQVAWNSELNNCHNYEYIMTCGCFCLLHLTIFLAIRKYRQTRIAIEQFFSFYMYKCGTVVWCKKAPGAIHGWGWGLSVRSLHVLPVPVWVLTAGIVSISVKR